MNEFISRDEAYQQLHDAGGCGATDEWSKGYDEAIGVAIGIIEDAPAADVAPVVRCLECKNFKSFPDGIYGSCTSFPCRDRVMKTTDYCSYGVKKESEDKPCTA